MQQKDSANMQELRQQDLTMMETERQRRPIRHARASQGAPLAFLLAVGIAALALLYLGARELVLPMLFLSLPLATVWLIVNNWQSRD